MDIQKEREAFEQALVNQKNVSINNLHVCTIFDAEKNKYSPSDVCDPKEDFIVDWINSSWSIWQAAKAQADQKIKLLLCDEHLKKCESPTGVFNSQYPDEEPCLICLAKEAKAQAMPAQLDVNSILHEIDCYFDNGLSNTERTANNLLQSIYEKLSGEAKAQEQKFNLDEFLSMEEKLQSKGGIIKTDLDRFIAYAEMVLEKAKALKEPK